MVRKKWRVLLAGLGLSLIMTTGVWAASETPEGNKNIVQENVTDPTVQDDTLATTPEPTESPEEGTPEETEEQTGEEIPEVSVTPEVSAEPTAEPSTTPTATPAPTPEVPEATEPGWQETEQGIRYFEADAAGTLKEVTGWQDIDGKTYYFDEEGYLQTGWKQMTKYAFYFEVEGALGEKGAMALGWKDIDGKTFYFKKTGAYEIKGAMLTGIQNVGTKTYYFAKDGDLGTKGQMLTGWQDIDGKTYFLKRTGERGVKGMMLTGWQNIDSKRYYFKATGARGVKGVMLTGFQNIDSKTFFFKRTGERGVKGMMLTGWQNIDGKRYYFKATGARGVKGYMFKGLSSISGKKYYFNTKGARQSGWQKINGYWYYFNAKANSAMVTGWQDISIDKDKYYTAYSSYRFYFGSNGRLVQDVTSIIGKQKAYRAEISRTSCVVTIYAKDTSGKWRIPVKAMTCSVGLPATPTPKSTYTYPFNTIERIRWGTLMGPSYGQYCTRIVAGILFHSVAGSAPNPYALPAGEYNRLGSPASHGCVRLCVRDAKWIYDNCPLGMQVIINDNMYLPFDKPATIKIPASQNWDPTDPNI